MFLVQKHLVYISIWVDAKNNRKHSFKGITGATFTFLILTLRLIIQELAINKKAWTNTYVKYIIDYLIQAITVVVVAVPEGLPLAVTLALAFAVKVRD